MMRRNDMGPLKAGLINAGFYFAGLTFLLFFTFATAIDKDGGTLINLGRTVGLGEWFLFSLFAAAASGIPLGLITGIISWRSSAPLRTALISAAISALLPAIAIVGYVGRGQSQNQPVSDLVMVSVLIAGVFFSVFALSNLATIRIARGGQNA